MAKSKHYSLPWGDEAFLTASRQAFKRYAQSLGESITPQTHNGQFLGYLQPSTQARWTAFCEGLERASELIPTEQTPSAAIGVTIAIERPRG